MITTDEVKEFREILYKTKDVVNRLETNWELDRKDFSEFQNRLGKLEVEFKTLRDQILLLPKRTSDRMDSVVDDIEKAARDVENAVVEKKEEVVDNQPKLKRRWYYLWLFKTRVKARNTH